MSNIPDRIVKHRPAYLPLRCAHCGFIWYGGYDRSWGITLCFDCSETLKKYLDDIWEEKLEDLDLSWYLDEECKHMRPEIVTAAKEWIDNKNNKPSVNWAHKAYARSIPWYIKAAIDAQLVNLNDRDDPYVIFTKERKVLQVQKVSSKRQIRKGSILTTTTP